MKDIELIDKARDIGAAKCMKSLGFKEFTSNAIRTWSPGRYEEHDLLEYLDPTSARQSGYPRTTDSSASPPTSSSAPHQPTKEEMQALDGIKTHTASGQPIPEGGCAAQADREIYGADLKLPADSRGLAVSARGSTIQDSRMRAAISQWAACMAKNGLSYAHPVVAKNDPQWTSRDAGTPAGEEERRVAGIDADCQQEVNLVGIYKTLRVAYEQRLVEDNMTNLTASKPIFNKWISNAKGIIENG